MAIKKRFNPFTRKFDYVGDTAQVSPLAVFIQPTEPVLTSNTSIAIWEKTDTNQRLMVYKDSLGNQTLVELTN